MRPSQARLRKLLRYDRDTGILYWRARPASEFKDGGHSAKHNAKAWNARFASTPAGAVDEGGYIQVCLGGALYKAHRLIWVYEYGGWPDEIDHIDGDRTHNRLENLRSVSHAENLKNSAIPHHNTSGVRGVYWHKHSNKWLARISIGGRVRSLGYFRDLEDAQHARKQAERQYGYHPNHGRRPVAGEME